MTNTTVWTNLHTTPILDVDAQVSLGTFRSYGEAQQVVDRLADNDFEVQTTQIIGSDLRMVEQVTGRLTWPRAMLYGMASGAWFGFVVGLIFSFLVITPFLAAILWGLALGLVAGGVFALAGYGLTGRRRDFTSRSATVPSRFEVLVATAHSERARSVLAGAAR